MNKRFIWWFLLTAITAVLLIPALNIKFLWIDDGFVFTAAQKVAVSISTLNFRDLGAILFEEGGRLRTIYWLYQALAYSIGGLNSWIYFVIHFLVVLITAIYIFETVKDMTKSNTAGFFAGTLYLLTPTNTENLYRLGPQEPLLALFIVASLYYLFKNKLGIAVLFLFLATFVKEVGFVLWLPILGLYLIKRVVYKKRDLSLEKYCIWGFVFFSLVFLNTIFRRSGYSTYYIFDVGTMIGNLLSYLKSLNQDFAPFLVIFGLSAVIRTWLLVRSGKFRKGDPVLLKECIFLGLFAFLLVIQSPWKFILSRYMMPATVGLVVFMGIEFGAILKYLSKRALLIKRTAGLLFIGYFVVYIGVNIIKVTMVGEKFAYHSNFIQSLFSYLAVSVPKEGTVLYNFEKELNTEEPIIQTDILLKFQYNRPDIKVDYLDLENIPNSPFLVVGTSIVKERYSRDLIEKSIRSYHGQEDITREGKFYVLTTPFSLIKQTARKLYDWKFNNVPLNSEGIYAYYVAKDYWYLYSQP